MAQTGFTPISIYYSSTATNVPTAGNLVAGELAINTADGKLFYKDSAGVVQVIGTKGGVGSSTTTQVLYNSSGLVVGSANMTFSGTALTLANDASISGLTVGKGGGSQTFNTAVGSGALNASNGNSGQVGIGYQSLYTNTTGYGTAVGFKSLYSNTTGASNTAIGLNSSYSNTTGGANVSLGENALYSNTTASNNTAVGYQAGYSNTTGSPNTFIGYQAGYSNTTSLAITAIGYKALYANTANSNTAVGYLSLTTNTTGASNCGFGQDALGLNTTGGYNSAFGTSSLYNNTTASNNTAVGYTALYSNTTGATNTAIGYQSLYANTTGTLNVAMGDGALSSNTNGGSNTAFGSGCLAAHTTGTNNTAIGRVAGSAITTGTYNTILGSQDSTLTTGSYNAFIGRYANASASSVSYALMINTDNTARTDKGSSSGFIFTGGSMYQGNNSATWAITSDARLKKNIVNNTTGLDAINAIQVRNFEYRTADEITDLPKDQAVEVKGIQLGAIAQEIQAILPECVKTESTGVMSVDTTNLTWYLINAVKELNAKITALENK